jgi:hypothetical protein
MPKSQNWQSIKDRIALRTGLTLDDQIEAYAHFCLHADSKDGLLLEGDIQHEFYIELMKQGGPATRIAEDKFYKENIEGKHVEWPYPESPLSCQARELMEQYRGLFEARSLVSKPMLIRKIPEPMRVLRGYNYFNDSDFYTRTKNAHGTRFELVTR